LQIAFSQIILDLTLNKGLDFVLFSIYLDTYLQWFQLFGCTL